VTTWRNVALKKSHHFTKAPNCHCISVPLPRGAITQPKSIIALGDWAGRCHAPAAEES
jgi:hypothetical protein